MAPLLQVIVLENVNYLLSKDMRQVLFEIIKWLTRLGFHNIRYVSVAACNAGLPQERRRWFCMATKDTTDVGRLRRLLPAMLPEEIEALAAQPWNGKHGNAVPVHEWLLPSLASTDRERLLQLGNAVVPGCARLAATFLANM